MANKLNVCLMNDSFPPVIDGVANSVVNYANVIASGLGKPVVVTPEYPDVVDDYPFEVLRYRSMPITERICGYRAGYPFSSSKLERLSDIGIDVIHSHCPFASTVMARVLREKVNAPIIFTYHTKFDIDIRRALSTKLVADQAIRFIISNISACDEVWTVSHGAGENLRNNGFEGKYFVMENGVDFKRGRADAERVAALKSSCNIPLDKPTFLFVGRLLWYKGIKLILDALRLVADRGCEFRMMFVGDGADRQEISDYANEIGLGDVCVFTGAIYDREELRAYYTAGDLFLFPSEYDTNGIVVREAAACSVASLLIEDSCAAEGITDGRTGILCSPNAEDIAKRLEFACSHLDEMHDLGKRAMDEVYISWEDSVKKAYDRYFTVIENYRQGQSTKREGVLAEEFFSVIDAATNSVQRFRSIFPRRRE